MVEKSSGIENASDSLVQMNKLALVVGIIILQIRLFIVQPLSMPRKMQKRYHIYLGDPSANSHCQGPLLGEKATSVAIKHCLIALGKKRTTQDFLLFYLQVTPYL